MEQNQKINDKLKELNEQWSDLFSDDISAYAFADNELDEEDVTTLLYETAKVLKSVIPFRTEDCLPYWEETIKLFAYLKAYSVYPSICEDEDMTVAFDASKMVADRLINYFGWAQEHYTKWDIFSDFNIGMDGLPDDYEKNPVGEALIPYDLKSGDLSLIKKAIKDGGYIG